MDAERPVEEIPPSRLIRSVLVELLSIVIPAAIMAFLIHRFVAETTVVFGESMEPELYSQQRLVVEKVSYLFQNPRQGQMVVIEVDDVDANLIKRVIALPGDRVAIHRGQVMVNGIQMDEPYVHYHSRENMDARVLAPDEYFVMGDNRSSSRDSRDFGPVLRRHIVGRAWMRYWPFPDLKLFPA